MTAKHVVEVNDLNFSSEVLAARGTVLVDFTAKWCGPCKMVAPLVEKIARDRVGSVKVTKIDIDDSPGAATELAIRGAPTFVVLRDGKEVRRHTGALAERGLLALIEGG
jgi:thioredoxin 1